MLKALKCGALGFALIAGAINLVTPADADIVYNVDLSIGQYGTVVGTITTDATGTLSADNIVAWNLTLTGPGAPPLNLTNSNSSVDFFSGTDLTATSQYLLFDFSGAPGTFTIQENGYDASGQFYYCDQALSGGIACLSGASDVPQYYLDPSSQFDPDPGSDVIGIAAVPEPRALALFGMALLALGGLSLWRKFV